MLKYISTFLLIGIFAISGYSQISNDLKVYQEMKEEGNLPLNFEFSTPEILFQPSTKDIENANSTLKKPSGGCGGCYVTPDNTYTLAMGPNDDGSTIAIPIPFTFCLYGTNYTSLYINNNGNVSFGGAESAFSSLPFPSSNYVMVAPFWGDVDTRSIGTVKYKINPNNTSMIINWDDVGYYSSQSDKTNTFQLIITDGSDPILPPGNNIAFCYADMQWTTGSASGGTGGFGGTPATVGVNKGNGVDFIQLGRFDQPGAAYDGGGGANDGVSWLDNQSFYFNVCSSTNIAPIANFTPSVFNGAGGSGCDTLKMCGIEDTLIINSLFLSPEIGQTTTVSVNFNGASGMTILNNTPGNPANTSVRIVASPANAGLNTITYTAVDDGVPAETTIVSLNVFIDTTGLSAFNPIINGNLEFCEGNSTILNVSPTNLTSYIWNTGSIDTSITISSGGDYWVTSELNGCYKTVEVEVVENPIPTPEILGPLFTCSANPTTLYVDSVNLYSSVLWSNSATTDSISVVSGSYTVTATDTNGCSGLSPQVTVINTNPAVTIVGDTNICQNHSSTLTATPTITSGAQYLWSTGDTVNTINLSTSGNVWVTVNYNNGCFANDTIFATVTPPISFSQSDTICQGDNYTLPSGQIVTQSGSYVDTIPSSIGCDSIITTNLNVTPLPNPTIIPITSTCEGYNPFSFSAVDNGGIWSGTGITNPTTGEFSPANAGLGLHQIIYTINGACSDADTTYIVVNPSPTFTLSQLEDTCSTSVGTAISTVISGISPYSYLWSRGDNSPNIFSVLTGSYSLTVTDSNNCSTTETIYVGNMANDCSLLIPNVVTPNGDGQNDYLFFDGLYRFPNSQLAVFNRWGQKIYESDNYQNDWSPTDVSDGTYYFILTPGGKLDAKTITSSFSVFVR